MMHFCGFGHACNCDPNVSTLCNQLRAQILSAVCRFVALRLVTECISSFCQVFPNVSYHKVASSGLWNAVKVFLCTAFSFCPLNSFITRGDFPTHQGTQRMSVATRTGSIVVYDMNTRSKWQVDLVPDETLSLFLCSFMFVSVLLLYNHRPGLLTSNFR